MNSVQCLWSIIISKFIISSQTKSAVAVVVTTFNEKTTSSAFFPPSTDLQWRLFTFNKNTLVVPEVVFHHPAFDQLSNQSLLQIQVEEKTDPEKDHWITGVLPLSSTLNAEEIFFLPLMGTLWNPGAMSQYRHIRMKWWAAQSLYIYIHIHIYTHIHNIWRGAWQPTPVFLPGEFHQLRSLAGYSPWSRKESDTTERLSTAQHINIGRVRTGWHCLLL